MTNSTHHLILQICAQLDANSLPVSVGLVKAKSHTSLPLPILIKSINAYKSGERAPESTISDAPITEAKENASLAPRDLEGVIKLVQTQQHSIEQLQAQVSHLQALLKA